MKHMTERMPTACTMTERPSSVRALTLAALLTLAAPAGLVHAQSADSANSNTSNKAEKPDQVGAADSSMLADERWQEHAYGLSLRPPRETEKVGQTTDGALVHFVHGKDYHMRVFVRSSLDELDVEKVKQRAKRRSGTPFPVVDMSKLRDRALKRIAFAAPSARVLVDERAPVAGRPGVHVLYRMRSQSGREWVFGQVFMKIDPHTVAMFEIEADADVAKHARRLFNAMLASVKLTDPQQLNKQRKQWVQNGKKWLSSVTRKQLQNNLVDEQWRRVLENGKDVGYIRVRQQRGRMLGQTGIQVNVQQRIYMKTSTFDTFSELFESDDGALEVWSIRTARRDGGPKAKLPARQQQSNADQGPPRKAWAETGLRDGDQLTVSREMPTKIDEDSWADLPDVYLSQAVLELVPSMLPPDQQQTLAFYAYYPKTSDIGLRTMKVVPLASGGYRVHQQPMPDRSEQVATYDAHGRLVQKRMADGRVILPSSRQRIRRIWEERGREFGTGRSERNGGRGGGDTGGAMGLPGPGQSR